MYSVARNRNGNLYVAKNLHLNWELNEDTIV
jgi:hypothetical protein